MAAVSARTDVPLATNMCVIAMEHLPPAIAQDAVQVVLSDHHLWGGLRKSALLGGITEVWGLGLSMHSNSHLGVSLAAMVHLAAATPVERAAQALPRARREDTAEKPAGREAAREQAQGRARG